MENDDQLGSHAPDLGLDLDASTVVNFAMHQNDIAILRRLRVRNNGKDDLTNLIVSVSSEPEFAHSWQYQIERIPSESAYDLGVVDIPLAPKFLSEQTEATKGYLNISVTLAEQVVHEERLAIEVLAYDEWNGLRSLPELLGAFVMPNHPVVEQVLRKAADILNQWTGDAALSGYQSRSPERVRLQTAAIYEAVRQYDIAYTGVPASFEETGQKVRTPDRIIEARLGNCLDLSALMAAGLEQAGLHPMICIIEGHAFTGVWLVEDMFPDPAVDDCSAISKRRALGEICVFEATAITNNGSFKEAERLALRHLDDPEKFVYALDVRRARSSHIRPISMRRWATDADTKPVNTDMPSVGSTHPPTDVEAPVHSVEPDDTNDDQFRSKDQSDSQPLNDRLEQWKRQLLDLSLRNTLLNFRETKRTAPLLSSSLSDLENTLAEGRRLAIYPMPDDWRKSERDPDLFHQRTGDDAVEKLLVSEFEKGRLRSTLDEGELQRRLTEIYRAARLSLEENGANTLYLSLGNLLWYETQSPGATQRRAPLLLLPMTIHRQSVHSPFGIELRDEEAVFNITLLEMLRSRFDLDITGFETLPMDDKGIDVPKVFRRIRQAIKHMPRWDLEERAYLGHFSFTKFLMWQDLVNRTEDLKKNKLVASLINFPHQPLPVSSPIPDVDTLDEAYKPADTFCPLSADSSQLAAVYAAAEGNTFVLHGPPGTGKSQTITNMIAQALGQGKTVLFVAEKMAALDVVQRRLSENGLGEFCLELHSNKSRKADVIRQFGDTLHLAHTREPANWSLEADRVGRLRTELNAYVEALHRPRESGDSFFTAVSKLIQYRSAPKVTLNQSMSKDASPEKLSLWREQIRALVRAGSAVGHPSGHAWAGAQVHTWSSALRDDVLKSVEKGKKVIAKARNTVGPVADLFGMSPTPLGSTPWDVLQNLTELALQTSHFPATLVDVKDWEHTRDVLDSCMKWGRERDELRTELYERFNEGIVKLDLDRMIAECQEAKTKWFLPKMLFQRRIMKTLKQVAKPGVALGSDELDAVLAQAARLRELKKELSIVADTAQTFLGRLWMDGEADWDAVQDACDWAFKVREQAAKLAGTDLAWRQQLREKWSSLFSEGRDAFGDNGAYTSQLNEVHHAGAELKTVTDRLTSLLSMHPESEWVGGTGDDYLHMLETTMDTWAAHIGGLRLWCLWQEQKAKVTSKGLGPIVDAYESGMPHDEVVPCFERSYYERWTDMIMNEDDILRRFSRHSHEEKIKEFRDLDDRFRDLTKQMLRARLLSRVPQQMETSSGNSEMGILRHEVQKKTRHMPIRALFNRTPNLLTRLKPCLLMSPISVAQYLDAGFPSFDLVIFDEASQIPTWDAVGAIARGTETIIVGDPKQLPPTNFFSRADESEDDDVDIGTVRDLESILDDCLALDVRQHYLKWHYRSRHEALIAFSNAEYYQNSLYTFPSPQSEPAVRLRYVEGVYDRGRSRTNRIEADTVVEEIVTRLMDPERAGFSIGVVTFSSAQQRLIEDLLDEACRLHPEIEPYFGSDVLEPVFVKNLENVQGDERDIILFSIGYGPDSIGKISMNFGPLNRLGGERRLNVAITRARHEVQVFSSLRSNQINLAQTRQRGVKDLKTFLEYAEHGPVALDRKLTLSSDGEPESPFEQDVMDALGALGYDVVPQVGCSGYRIDLAVVDPNEPGRFVLGVECDGATYHSAKNARDRDKLREGVLRDLGWDIYRVWSTDWWQDRDGEIERLEGAIQSALLKSSTDLSTLSSQPSVERVVERKDEKPHTRIAAAPTPTPEEPDEVTEQRFPDLPVYTLSKTHPDKNALKHDMFSYQVIPAMRKVIEDMVADEGPISLNLAARRMAEWWDISRVTNRVIRWIENVVSEIEVKKVTHGDVVFLWPNDVDVSKYDEFRLPEEEETRRDVQDLPPEEIANALFYVVCNQVALPREDLVREGARLLGYQRTGRVVEQCMLAGIELLENRGLVHEVNDMVVEVRE